MESALAAIILTLVLLFAVLTFSHTNLTLQDELLMTEREMRVRMEDQAQTGLAIVSTEVMTPGAALRLVVRNTGALPLADYDRWDVIVAYQPISSTFTHRWLPYATGGLQVNQWTTGGIFINAGAMQPEAFNRGILDPGEELVVRVLVSPTVAMTTTNQITFGVDNGMNTSALFYR